MKNVHFAAALALLLLLVAAPAVALDVPSSTAEVTFHISHPAKEYDCSLLAGGAVVTGRFDPADIARTGVTVEIDASKFNSGNTRRDSHMIESLEALVFPTINWEVDGISGVSGPLVPGTYQARASGPLTLHGVNLDLSVPIAMTVGEDGTIVVTSEFEILLEEYGIERATLVFVPIANEIPITVRMVFPGGADVLYSEPPPAPPEPETPAPDSGDIDEEVTP